MKAAVVLVAAIMLTSCGEDRHATYASYATLTAAGAGAKSWFPKCTPSSAVDLEEVHNLDSNIVVGRFRVPMRDLSSMSSNCGVPVAEMAADLNPGLSMWPECLRGHITSTTMRQCGLMGYRESQFLVAINRKTGDVFFWSR